MSDQPIVPVSIEEAERILQEYKSHSVAYKVRCEIDQFLRNEIGLNPILSKATFAYFHMPSYLVEVEIHTNDSSETIDLHKIEEYVREIKRKMGETGWEKEDYLVQMIQRFSTLLVGSISKGIINEWQQYPFSDKPPVMPKLFIQR